MFGPMMGAAKGIGSAMTGMGGGKSAAPGQGVKDVLMGRLMNKGGGMPQEPQNTGFAGGMPGASPVPQMPKQMPSMGGIGSMLGGAMGRGAAPMSGMGSGMASGITNMMNKRSAMSGGTKPFGQMPNIPQHLPSRMERFKTANMMADGYRNGWNPNPVMTGLMR